MTIRLPSLRLLRGRALLQDARGATAVEFALIAPVLLTMILGSLDFGHWVYTKAVLNGAVLTAARNATLETADTTAADNTVTAMVQPVAPGVTVTSTRMNYYDFTDVGRAERWNDTNSDGRCNNGETYVDENENGQWDADIGQTGNGGASDVVVYTVTATYSSPFTPPFFPASWRNRSMTVSTTLKNQPFAYQVAYGSSTGVCN